MQSFYIFCSADSESSSIEVISILRIKVATGDKNTHLDIVVDIRKAPTLPCAPNLLHPFMVGTGFDHLANIDAYFSSPA